MRNNFLDHEAVEEPYFKVDQVVPAEQLSRLKETYCPIDKGAMLESIFKIVRIYQELAISLAQAHAIAYPEALEAIMVQRLEDLQVATS